MAVAAINFSYRKSLLSLFAFVCILSLASISKAEDYVTAQSYIHSFDNGVAVYTELFALNKDFNLNTSAYVKYNLDLINPSFGGKERGGGDGDSLTNNNNPRAVAAVSGASSANTNGGGKDTRHDILAGVTHNFNNVIGVEAYLDYSKEQDYTSKTPTLTLKKDLFEKNTTLTAGYSMNIDTISGQYMNGKGDRTTDNYFAGVTQALTPDTVAQVGYSRSVSRGFEAEGIRLVPLGGVAASSCTARTASCEYENFPGKRRRNAYLAGLNHYFSSRLFEFLDRSSVHLQYRYYKDSWNIRSNTAEIEYYKYFSDEWLMRLDYRYYTQSKAFFHNDAALAADEFKSASPQLKSFNTNLVGAKLVYNFKDTKKDTTSWIQNGSLEGKYEFYTQSINVNAHVFMIGLRLLM